MPVMIRRVPLPAVGSQAQRRIHPSQRYLAQNWLAGYTGPLVGAYGEPLIDVYVSAPVQQPPRLFTTDVLGASHSAWQTKGGLLVSTSSAAGEVEGYRNDNNAMGPDMGNFAHMMAVGDLNTPTTGTDYLDMHVRVVSPGTGSTESGYVGEIWKNLIFAYKFTNSSGTPIAPTGGVAGPTWAPGDAAATYAIGSSSVAIEVWRWAYSGTPNVGTWTKLTTFTDSTPSANQQLGGYVGWNQNRGGLITLSAIGGGTVVVALATITDSGVVTATVSPTEAEAVVDLGTVTATASLTEGEVLVDQATVTATVTPSESELLIDPGGTVTGTVALSSAEAIVDQSFTNIASTFGYNGAGTATLAAVQGKEYAVAVAAQSRDIQITATQVTYDLDAAVGSSTIRGAIWLDDGSGNPGALLSMGAAVSTGAGPQTASGANLSVAPNNGNVTIPAGTAFHYGFIGTVNAGNMAIGYIVGSGGYNVSNATGLSTPQDPFGTPTHDGTKTLVCSAGFKIAEALETVRLSGTQAYADSGTVTETGSLTFAEVLIDQATLTETVTPSESEIIVDVGGTVTGVVTPSGADAVADASTVTATGTPTVSGEAIVESAAVTALATPVASAQIVIDQATVTGVGTPSASEAIVDQATDQATISVSGTQAFADFGTVTETGTASVASETIVEAASIVETVTQTEVETLIDQSTLTGTIALSGSEAVADQGSLAGVVTVTGAEALAESATVVAVGGPTLSGETILELNALTGTVTPSAAASTTDQGTVTGTGSMTAGEAVSDQGTATGVGTPTVSSETILDQVTVTAAVTPTSAESLTDQGTVTGAAAMTAAEAIVDQGSVTELITLSGQESVSGGNVIDSGTATAVISLTGAEVLIESAGVTAIVAPTELELLIDQGSLAAVGTPSATEAISDQSTVTAVGTQSGSESLSESSTLVATVTAGVLVTNLYTSGDFETAAFITGYGSGGTNTIDATEHLFGTHSLKHVRAATFGGVGTNFIPVSPATSYAVSIYVKGTPGTVVGLRVLERNGVGGTTADNTQANVTMDGTWQRITLMFTSNAATATLSFGITSSSVNQTFYLDGWQLELTQVGSPWPFVPTDGVAASAVYGLSEAIVDQATDTAAVSSSGVGYRSPELDSGIVQAFVVPLGSEAVTDRGTLTETVSISGAENQIIHVDGPWGGTLVRSPVASSTVTVVKAGSSLTKTEPDASIGHGAEADSSFARGGRADTSLVKN